MILTRRHFGRQAVGVTAFGLLQASGAERLLAEEVEPQPFAAQSARLVLALRAVGAPLSDKDEQTLRVAREGPHNASTVAFISAVLDTRVLLEVTINPESRLSIRRGAAPAELVQGGWRAFLVKVHNEAHITAPLVIRSPQGGAMGRRSSLAITGVHDFTNGAVDEVEARGRWIGLAGYDLPPLMPTLSGLGLEYRILQIYSRDAGEREASLQADAGFGEQDLGFRSTLPVLFHCTAAHRVRLGVLDEHLNPSTASLLITDAQGRVYPAQGKRALPDLAFEPQIYRSHGEFLPLPAGSYTVVAGRGPEYLRQQVPLQVSGSDAALEVRLQRWVEPVRFGYFSGDTHIHAAGCSHYESPTEGVTPEVMKRQVAGEALDVGSVLNWGPGFEYQKQFFSGHAMPQAHATGQHEAAVHHPHAGAAAAEEAATPDAVTGSALLRYDVEVSGFPSSHCGHLVLLRLKSDRYPGAEAIGQWPSWNLPILQWAKAQGAVTGYAHAAHGLVVESTELPNYLMPPFNSMGANEFLVDITHPGMIDFLSGCDLWPFAELNIWYHTLNCGYRSAFAGETDFPCITDECVGGGRTYARLSGGAPQGDEGYSAWLGALTRGDAYFGDGHSHIFDFSITSESPPAPGMRGFRQTVRLRTAEPMAVTAQVCARLEPEQDARTRAIATASPYSKPYWHLERARVAGTRRIPVELVVNGKAVDRTEIIADGTVQPVSFRFTPDRSSWCALRILPSAHTNPLFVELAGKPVRASRRSAQWCRDAVDVCWSQKRTRIRPAELAAAAAAYDHARAAYDAIIREAVAD